MEPIADEKVKIVCMGTLADWAGLDTTVTDGASPRSLAFAALGVAPTTHYRLIAAAPEADYVKVLDTVGPTGGPASFIVASILRLMYSTARRLCLLEPWPSAAVPVTSTALAAPSAPGTVAPFGNTFKLNLVIDQANDSELEVLGDTDIITLYSNYVTIHGGMPAPDVDPSVYQLTAVQDLITKLKVPYVDFSIFVPHALRNMKRLKMTGTVVGHDGRHVPVEVFGPPSFDLWERSYDILSTTLCMTKSVSISALGRYKALIKRFASRYGPTVWHLIYQADVRMRSEHMERMRITAMHDRAVALAAGKTHPFDPASPWEHLWESACSASEWWNEELQESALLVLTKTASLSSLVGGDAAIVPSGHNFNPARQHSGQWQNDAPPLILPPPTASSIKKARNKTGTIHNVSNGMYSTNRKGIPLCEGFQTGACLQSDPRTNRCTANPGTAHQCRKCLGTSHGAGTGSGCPALAPADSHTAVRFNKGGKGDGKGKGKGKGKG